MPLFQSFDNAEFAEFSNETYVQLKMVLQEEHVEDKEKSRQGGGSKDESIKKHHVQERVSGNAQLLAPIYKKPFTLQPPVLILGQPGQGKTTFIRKLAYDWAMAQNGKATHEMQDEEKVILKDVSLLLAYQLRRVKIKTEENILKLILNAELLKQIGASFEDIRRWIRKNQSKVLVVLDGYDELIDGSRLELQLILSQMPQRLPDFPLMLTTRQSHLPKTCPSYLRFEICDLDADQACELIKKHGKGCPPEAVAELVGFAREEGNSFIFESPLLLHLLCCRVLPSRQNTATTAATATTPIKRTPLRLPRSQTEAYSEILKWLPKQRNEWNVGGSQPANFVTLLDLLESTVVAKLAAFAFNNVSKSVFSEVDVVSSCTKEVTDKAKQLGYLIADAPFYGDFSSDVALRRDFKLSFAHRTIQEFFAAAHFVNRLGEEHDDKSLKTLFDQNLQLEKHRQILLFATGIAWATDASRRGKKLFQLVGERIIFMLRKNIKEYDGDVDYEEDEDYKKGEESEESVDYEEDEDYKKGEESVDYEEDEDDLGDEGEFLLALLKDLFREANQEGKLAMKLWAIQNSNDFERFSPLHVSRNISNYDEVSPLYDLVDALLPLDVKVSTFRQLCISSSTFVFGYSTPDKDGSRSLCVCELASPADSIVNMEEMTVKNISDFRFDGTSDGFAKLLCGTEVDSNAAWLCISNQRRRTQTAAYEHIAKGSQPKRTTGTQKSTFRHVWLSLSSQFVGNQVKNVFDDLEAIAITTKMCQVRFFADARRSVDVDDGSFTARDDSEIALCREVPTTISDYILALRYGVIPTFSAFVALLSSVRENDRIEIDDTVFSLLDEFAKLQTETQSGERRFAARVGLIDCDIKKETPSVSLAKFAAVVNAKHLQLRFWHDVVVEKASFRAFCVALADREERVRERPLEKIELSVFTLGKHFDGDLDRHFDRDLDRHFYRDLDRHFHHQHKSLCAAIVDPLVELMRCSQALRLQCDKNIFCELSEKFPGDLSARISRSSF